MNLDFVTTGPGGRAVAESPLASAARAAGATLGLRGGWLVPASFGEEAAELHALSETVGFGDASALEKVELQGPPELIASLAGGLSLGSATPYAGAWWCPLTPTRTLVIGAIPEPSEVERVSCVPVTTQFCALRIQGPLARRLVSGFCALDLRPVVAPPGSVRPGSVARTPGLVLVEAEDRLLVIAGAAFGQYLWSVVSDGAARLGGRPVGTDLLDDRLILVGETASNA